ncbi:hypothetical protein SK128_026903 [Halocaridina rubra]|uniref:Uncharacterized protein n=1 Tax=Halocaridina rubra TaxID=373956 RepID=A0AAN8WPK2_HALRR
MAYIVGFQISDQAYDDAITALTDRFANTERVKQALLLNLFDIPRPKKLEKFRLD